MWSPFVVPDVVRIPLGHGQWIDVKRELTYGETEEMYARMRKQFGQNEMPLLDPTRIGRARMEAFLVAWSFTDANGKPVPVTESAFADLRPSVAREIREALESHEEDIQRVQDVEKNDRDGANVSSPTSPSVS
jgi:hypothetical protein